MTERVSAFDEGQDLPPDMVLAGVEMMFRRKKAPWSPHEIAIVREHYPKGGLAAVKALLPYRTDDTIHWKARSIGVRALGYQRRTEQWTTTLFIDDAIRRYYLGTPRKGGLSKLAHQLNRPASWVSSRARHLGITPPRFKEQPWSDREIELLRQHAAKVPTTIAKILKRYGFTRSSGAVSVKLNRLRCDRSDDDNYTGTGLAALFGVRVNVVSGWIRQGWLKAQMKGTTREHDIYRIHHKAVRRFVIENAGAIDVRRVDKIWFIDLLAGPE